MNVPAVGENNGRRLIAILLAVTLLVLGSTAGVIFYALSGLAVKTNQIDNELTEQAARAALRAIEQRVRDINIEFSRFDSLLPTNGPAPFDRRMADLCAGTQLRTNFDVFFLVDDRMRNLGGCADGEKLAEAPTEFMGRALAPIIRDVSATLKRNPLRSGFMLTRLGIAAVAVGPAWWSAAESGYPTPAILIIGKRLDRTRSNASARISTSRALSS